MTSSPKILLATGASGGHMFPALSVATALKKQGCDCVFIVGGSKFNHLVTEAGFTAHHLPASALNVRSFTRKLKGGLNLVRAFIRALCLIQKEKPDAIFGTGGYATVALVLAGKLLGVPTLIHEQNVMPGRANTFLSRFADHILLTFEGTRSYLPKAAHKTEVTGYPLRPEAQKAATQKHTRANAPLRLLVLGGSQGSRILSEVIPEAIALLDNSLRQNLFIHHQARTEDESAVIAAYEKQNLAGFDVTPFIKNMTYALSAAHLFVGRSGTGTVAEMCVFGRPAIYVPLSLADGHQALNAHVAEKAGAAHLLMEKDFTPEALATKLKELLTNADLRTQMEKTARAILPLDGAEKTAAAVLAAIA